MWLVPRDTTSTIEDNGGAVGDTIALETSVARDALVTQVKTDSVRRWDWQNAVRDVPVEHAYTPLRIEGTLPADLRGTMFRAGPALMGLYGRTYGHVFDGDGAISGVRFADGRAEGSVKLVQSAGLLDERRAGRAIYSGYGTRTKGWFREALGGKHKNPANTSVMYWNKRLYALWEGGFPTEISPETLDTIGETDFDSVLTRTFSAHPHAVPSRKARYNFGMRYGRKIYLDIFELPDEGAPRLFTSVPLAHAAMVHDFIATDRHLVFFVPPARLRLLPLVLHMRAYSECLHWEPAEGTEVIVVPLDDPSRVTRFRTDAFYQWHFANAYERSGEIVVDFIKFADLGTNDWLKDMLHDGPSRAWDGHFTRATIDLGRRTMRSEQLSSVACEFPVVADSVATREHTRVNVAVVSDEATKDGRDFFDRVGQFDLTTGTMRSVSLGERTYPLESLFVPRPGAAHETDGYLLTLAYDSKRDASFVAVLDASEIERGAIAKAWFDHPIGYTFHGTWVPMP